MARRDIDLVVLGGGLAGGLIALALAARRPDLDVLVVEAGETLGGNHVWSFFASDIAREHRWLVEPLVVQAWDRYDVAFPGHARTLPTPYRSVTSERLDYELRQTLPPRAIRTGARVENAGATHVALADGTRIEGRAVIDARGMAMAGELTGGWQKFVGRRIETARPHGLDRPLVMDATVEQIDGYRFVYCLPFSDTELLVEDTYYSDDGRLDRAALRARIDGYIGARGWKVARVLGEEAGVLPVVSGGNFAAFWRATGTGVAKAGTRAGLFHPLTGYSLPAAVRFAATLAGRRDLSAEGVRRFSEEQARATWRRGAYARRLAAMLFGAAAPDRRYRVLERFYRLDRRLIERFYAGRLTLADKVRILSGRPPVPVGRALGVLAGIGPARTRLRRPSLPAPAA